MATKEDSYFYDRAEAELKMAQTAAHPAAVRAHYLLAGHYLDRFYGDSEQGALGAPLSTRASSND
ncbi:hypothetical protein [Sphingomonas sp. S2-65]|uniref:hypothetical protein n=1 Tax=Sphingomonas sp. S2-65 TaxID=2903960 RepID=UPI001F3EEB20|nr:hypothetical protein [Sphingomonas sp. S2-65]UYY58570.1 hypothetical protein LZ586_00145 [Sphingomonas sp. S2-65]